MAGMDDKINIYLPAEVGDMLERDVTLFEIFKKDGMTPNRNRFLNMLVQGYYETYSSERLELSRRILSTLEERSVTASDRDILVNRLMEAVTEPVPASVAFVSDE